VVIPDAEAGQLLWDDFAALSWRRARHVAMVHRGATQSESRHPVREVESRHLRGARVRAFEEDLGSVASEQVAMSLELIASVVTSRAFTVEVDGEPVSWAVLYEETGIGEIDDVVTAGEHRRRGYGRAVVEAATRASLDSGNEITFLIADDEDWPKEMYARMGYETVDTRYEYTRM
jgi:predicted GNAT family acetyltransferase